MQGTITLRLDDPTQDVVREVRACSWQSLYERDQLREQIASGRAFYGFDDALGFGPALSMQLLQTAQGPRRSQSCEVLPGIRPGTDWTVHVLGKWRVM